MAHGNETRAHFALGPLTRRPGDAAGMGAAVRDTQSCEIVEQGLRNVLATPM